MDTKIPLRITSCRDEALGVKAFELVHAEGLPLAPVEAGAHIELHLADQLQRCYSLLNAPGETHRYQIAVHLSPDSKGGSKHVHKRWQVGEVVLASAPRNHFPLQESAAHSCLIAGGIGITPLLAMAHRLNALGRSWELHYCARTPAHAAFLDDVQRLAAHSGNACHFHFDHAPGGAPLNIAALVHSLPQETHLYCCGPKGMLESFEAATADRLERRHVEYFGARNEAALEGGFTVELARSKLVFNVPAGRSILDVVLDAGIEVPTSCREGICGTCETRILAGEADHRDALLMKEEQEGNRSMMICCSGAKSSRLVLDL